MEFKFIINVLLSYEEYGYVPGALLGHWTQTYAFNVLCLRWSQTKGVCFILIFARYPYNFFLSCSEAISLLKSPPQLGSMSFAKYNYIVFCDLVQSEKYIFLAETDSVSLHCKIVWKCLKRIIWSQNRVLIIRVQCWFCQ